jgi:hypothetical protein
MNAFGSATRTVTAVTVMLPQPQLKSFSIAGNGFRFTFQSILGVLYVTEYRDNLTDSAWLELSRQAGTGAPIVVNDPNPPGPRRFYRLRVE